LQMCLSSFGGSCNEWYEDCSVLECQCWYTSLRLCPSEQWLKTGGTHLA
jgi:hypothetical protein